uniref:Defensin-like protein n=1 Tax=Pentadiplandra brazzeana TaxID=43545 RepID=UPI002279E74A|nr:Chain A, Defensin-like protein [Pentadiplandra brazzeana]
MANPRVMDKCKKVYENYPVSKCQLANQCNYDCKLDKHARSGECFYDEKANLQCICDYCEYPLEHHHHHH